MAEIAPGAVPSPNIWNSPRVYEIGNRAVDPDGTLDSAMRAIRPWTGATVLDIGCGTGFHLPYFAREASHVIGVEPHGALVAAARRRVRDVPNVTVRVGAAQSLPLPDASVDVVHARWAYFFGPGCEPGLAELDRVVRRGGAIFIIDIDATRSSYGRWFLRGLPSYDPSEVERFWTRRGYQRSPLTFRWAFESRADLESVLRIDFAPEVAEAALGEHDGHEVDYAVNLWWRYV